MEEEDIFERKMQALRLVMRDVENLDGSKLSEFSYTAEQIMRSAKVDPRILGMVNLSEPLKLKHYIEISKKHPSVLDGVDIDSFEISDQEALELAIIGQDWLFEKISIDPDKISDSEKMRILRSNFYSVESLEFVGAFENDFDNPGCIREIISISGRVFIDRLNLNRLDSSDWLYIFKKRPDLIDLIDVELFLSGSVFVLIELCVMFGEFTYLITDKNAGQISSYGWFRIFTEINQDDRLDELCDYSKLEDWTWNKLEFERSDLMWKR